MPQLPLLLMCLTHPISIAQWKCPVIKQREAEREGEELVYRHFRQKVFLFKTSLQSYLTRHIIRQWPENMSNSWSIFFPWSLHSVLLREALLKSTELVKHLLSADSTLLMPPLKSRMRKYSDKTVLGIIQLTIEEFYSICLCHL